MIASRPAAAPRDPREDRPADLQPRIGRRRGMPLRAAFRRLFPHRVLFFIVLATAILSAIAAWHYAALGLTLSHYDAKAHLVVARRIFDSLTPGWRQIGAVWLPLPHVLNAIPVQVDAFYRTGLSGIAISMASFVLAVGATAWLVLAATGSAWASVAAAAILATDPHLLYLQATPMTEPLLVGLLSLSVALLYRWVVSRGTLSAAPPGWALVGACLTRYEAWPVMVATLVLAALALWRMGAPLRDAIAVTRRVAIYPFLAIVGFFILSRVTIGEWFVTGGFFVVDNLAYRHPWLAVVQVWWGVRQLVGTATMIVGLAGAGGMLIVALMRSSRAPMLVSLGLGAMGALPAYAFYNGHPFRIRYMVVLGCAIAACAGLGVGLLPRKVRAFAAAAVVALALVESPPFTTQSPFVAEAQWDRPNGIGRRAVTECLAASFDRPNEKILASMGSLAHYMQELSGAGFVLSDFIHEGVGELWPEALIAPRRHVEWILFEEQAEGGDELTKIRKQWPGFVAGFTRVCEGGGVALYRRVQQ